MKRYAVLDGAYRYSLVREWDPFNPTKVVFVMLNPSTADGNEDDQTTKVCIEFAKRWGYGSLEIVNLFAYRATNPQDLSKAKEYREVVGKDNDIYVKKALHSADKIVVAWGKHGRMYKRYLDKSLKEIFSNFQLYCFKLIANNQPKHPLGVRYDTDLIEYSYYKEL